MTVIKNRLLTLTVQVEIECTEPDSFNSQEEFDDQDFAEMKPYLSTLIKEALDEQDMYSAKAIKVTIT